MSADYDVVVAGGGAAGALVAGLLARRGLGTALIDLRIPVPPDGKLDPRVVAISPGSKNILAAGGVWKRLDPARIGPFDRMEVLAGGGRLSFAAAEHGLDRLGWIVELPALAAAAWADLQARAETDLLAPARITGLELAAEGAELELDGGRRISARILVAADGSRSRLRHQAGIAVDSWHYNQKALVAHLDTAEPNPGVAWQRFTGDGPLALLPLPQGRSSLVWSVPARVADQLRGEDDESFLGRLNEAITEGGDAPFGPVTVATRRHALPLVRRQARALRAGPLVLLGDAARSVHPLAGQGLNLGLLDAAELAEALDGLAAGEDPGPRLARYERRRISNGVLVAGGIHAFNELSAGGGGFGRRLLGAAFTAMTGLWPAREAFVRRACGLDAGAPALARRDRN